MRMSPTERKVTETSSSFCSSFASFVPPSPLFFSGVVSAAAPEPFELEVTAESLSPPPPIVRDVSPASRAPEERTAATEMPKRRFRRLISSY